MLDDRRPSPPPAKSWWRRYGLALFLVGLLASAGAVVLTASFLAGETAQAYGGGFDRAQWQEPALAARIEVPAVPGAPSGLTTTLHTASGAVLLTVHADGTVVMLPLDDGVLWPDAKGAFSQWAQRVGLAQPSYQGLVVIDDEGLVVAPERV